MPLAAWQATIVDEFGNVQAGASIEVRRESTGALAAIYADRDGNTPLSNPFNADSSGFARFHAPGGAFRITATKDGFSRTWRYVAIGLASEYDDLPSTRVRYERTADEISAGVTPTNYAYPPGDVRRYGAVGDGTTDDYQAIFNAIQCNRVVKLIEGATHYMSQSLIIDRKVHIEGGARGITTLLFDGDSEFIESPAKCAVLFKHSSTAVTGYSGDASYSSMTRVTVRDGGGTSSTIGIMNTCPVYLTNVEALSWSLHGFAVDASTSSNVIGNANGTQLMNCQSIQNDGDGYFIRGDNANACLFTRSIAFQNGGYGFNDTGGLGNTYIACETDGNTDGGFKAITDGDSAQRNLYLGCYSEINQSPAWDVGMRSMIIGATGEMPDSTTDGLYFGMIPNNVAMMTRELRFADSDDIANDFGGASHPGVVTAIGKDGISLRTRAGKQTIHLKEFSNNYAGLTANNNTELVLGIPYENVTGNVVRSRPFMPLGIAFGVNSAFIGEGTAPPTTGTYEVGAIVWNAAPTPSGFVGWVCVQGGTPGTWKGFGVIES